MAETWVYEANRRLRALLSEELAEGDVVVTHHLPSRRSIAPRYRHSPLNCFFLCDQEELIVERRPALWLHGHTHSSVDRQIGSTRIACNPFGYAVAGGLNSGFIDRLVIEK